MCQRPDRSNTTLIRDPAECFFVQWRYVDDRMIKPGNAKVFIDLVIDRVKYPDKTSQLITSHKEITRDKKGFHLKNQTQVKRFRVVYDKRVLFPDFTTLPYGY
ncbi:uncharacterized protein LOC125146163 [Tachysurus ichikawai]